jgi:hypothetical protein
MAVSVTSDLTDISACNNTTDGGTHYRLNGTSSGNPAADADAMVQGTGCIANKMGADFGATNLGGHFNSTATFNLTNKHIIHWRQLVTAGNMETKANRGIGLALTNTSVTSNTTWSTTNYKWWYLDGKDTVPTAQGWVPYVLDPTSTADVSAGTLTLTAVKNVGMICRQVSGVTTTVSNQFYDAIRMGTGLTATASSGGDTITFQSLYDTDKSNTNAWGIITQVAGVYYGAMKMTVGATGQTNACNFTDSNQVLVWRNQKVSTSLYEFNLKGASGNKTTMTLTGCVVRGQAGQTWNITCDANSDFKAYGCALANILTATLSGGSVLDGTSVSTSTTIDTGGATITGCAFSATKLKVDSTAEMAVITDSTFSSPGTGYAIELTVAGTYAFDGLTFTGYASSNGSTGNEAVYVNVASGSVTINVTGGNTPSYRTAGATVTVVSGSVTVSVTATTATGATVQDANVLLKAAAGGPFPAGATVTIANSGTTATVTHTAHGLATNDKVLIEDASHAANNGVFSVTVSDANTYTYTMGSTPGSNPTGTIKATFVLLKGLTNAGGQISMSRVFPSNQPVTGWARKASASPRYKTGLISGTVNSTTGAAFTGLLLADE